MRREEDQNGFYILQDRHVRRIELDMSLNCYPFFSFLLLFWINYLRHEEEVEKTNTNTHPLRDFNRSRRKPRCSFPFRLQPPSCFIRNQNFDHKQKQIQGSFCVAWSMSWLGFFWSVCCWHVWRYHSFLTPKSCRKICSYCGCDFVSIWPSILFHFLSFPSFEWNCLNPVECDVISCLRCECRPCFLLFAFAFLGRERSHIKRREESLVMCVTAVLREW